MKKIYLAAPAILFAGLAVAQPQPQTSLQKITPRTKTIHSETAYGQDRAAGDVIVQDNFSSSADWTMTADGNGNTWQYGTTTPSSMTPYIGPMASTTAANGFAYFNGIQYLLAGTVTAQDAVLEYTPVINCSGKPAVTLEFEQLYRAFNTDQTFVEVSGNNGVTYTQYELNASEPTNGPDVQELVSMDISAVAGNQSQVKIRFRWFNSSTSNSFGSGYGWFIDDFNVIEAFNYNQKITAAFARSGVVYAPAGLDYYLIPTSQIAPINFSATRSNLGAQIQTGATLHVTVDKGTNVYTGASTPVDLAFGASDSVGCTAAFTPASGLGTYDITFWVDGTNPEEVTNNDTMYSFIEITDYTYSRDNDDGIGSISAVSSSPTGVLQIGNVFEIFADGVIGAVDIAITNASTNTGQIMYAMVYRFNGTDYDLVGSSPDYTIEAGDLNSFIKLVLDNPVDVAAGDDMLIVAGHYGGADPVEFWTAQGVEQGTVLGFIDGSLFSLTGPSAVMVRADMRDFTGINEVNANNFNIGQNQPNPFNNTSVISYTLNETAAVNVVITDVTGKVVKTITPGTQAAGTYTLTVDGSDMAEGVYYYTFTVGDSKVTKQMVVSNK